MGADLRRRGSGFRWAASCHQIRAESAPIWRWISLKIASKQTTIEPRSDHDRAKIGPWSWINYDPRSQSAVVRSRGSDSTMKFPRSRLNRTAIMEFFHEPSTSSDCASGDWMVTIAQSRRPWLWGVSVIRWRKIVMVIVIAMQSVRWGSSAPASSTCHKVNHRSNPLTLLFQHVLWWMIAWTRVHAINGLSLDPTRAIRPRHLKKWKRVGT